MTIRLLAVFLLFFSTTLSFARPIPTPPPLSAKSYLLADAQSNHLIAEHNIDEQIEPASITKIMSAYLIFQALTDQLISEADDVLISEKAWRMEGSRMFIEAGKKVPVKALLQGMIVQSGNDATVALAEHVAGSEEAFVTLMNDQAKMLGMSHTHFMNSTGWPDPNHYTTARDILTLTQALIHDFPQYYHYYSQKTFTYNGISQSNRNRLLWLDKRVDGVKTGHTETAGYCLVASGQQDDMRLISVVLGTKSDNERTRQSKALLDYGFRFYETKRLYAGGEPLADAKVWKGDKDTVGLGIAEELYVTYPRGQYGNLNAQIDRPKYLEAPLSQNQVIGSVKLSLDGKPLAERPLIVLEEVQEGGIVSRLIDSLRLMWEK